MYSRKLGKTVLTFGHEGILYRNSFIMYDKGTGSLWVHTTGEAVKGPMKGQALEFLPSTITTWGRWKKLHPDTVALTGRAVGGFMGTLRLQDLNDRFGLSLGQAGKVKLYPFKVLRQYRVVSDEFDKQPVVLVFDPETASGMAFEATAGDTALEFVPLDEKSAEGEPLMQDLQTRSQWLRFSGRCIKGRLEGSELRQIPATPWLYERWRGFYPKGQVFSAGEF